MSTYAKDQPSGFINTIERVAIVGAGGTIGSHITSALLKTGKHTVTALSRKGSDTKLPEGVHVATVDYDDESTLIAALKGQQFFIITMSPTAPRDTQSKLVQAAAKAGVAYVMPNSYGGDIANIQLGEDTLLGPAAQATRDEISRLGMRWIAVCCGFWYDYSLAGGEPRFGFDLANRSLTLYDDGTVTNTTSTLAQVGRAVAALLTLPLFPADATDATPTVSGFLDNALYLASFSLSQTDIFASVKRVTRTTDADWTITHERSSARYAAGLAQVQAGNMAGFSKLLYARAFSPADPSDFSQKAQNALLGLPEEELDEATQRGIELVEVLKLRVERMAS